MSHTPIDPDEFGWESTNERFQKEIRRVGLTKMILAIQENPYLAHELKKALNPIIVDQRVDDETLVRVINGKVLIVDNDGNPATEEKVNQVLNEYLKGGRNDN